MVARKLKLMSLALVLMLLTGCPEDKILKASQLAKDFSVSVKNFQEAEIAAYDDPCHCYVDDEEHAAIQTTLLEVSTAGHELNAAILVAHSKPDALKALDASVAALEHLQTKGVLHIKNDAKRRELLAALLSMKTILNSINALRY